MPPSSAGPDQPTASVLNRVAESVSWYALIACVALLPLSTSITRGALGGTYALTDDFFQLPKLVMLLVLVGVATIGWGVDVLFGGRQIWLGTPQIALAVLAALIAVSTALAPEPIASFFGMSESMMGAIAWLTCLWACFLLSQYVRTGARTRQVSWALVGGATVVAAVGLFQRLGADPLGMPIFEAQEWMLWRAGSTFGNPDYTGTFLVVPAIVATALGLAEKIAWRQWLAYSCAGLIALVSFITLTRAAWLGLALGLLAFAYLNAGRQAFTRKRVAIGGIAAVSLVLVGVLAAGPEWIVRRFTLASGGLDSFSAGRVTLWGDTLRIVGSYPLLGTGADRLALGAYTAQKDVLIDGLQRYVLIDPHNAALFIAGIFGAPALLALATFLFMTLRSALASIGKNTTPSSTRTLYCGWTVGLGTAVFVSLLSVFPIHALFFLFVYAGVVGAPSLRPTSRLPWLAGVGALVALSLIGVGLYGTSLAWASSRQLMLARFAETQFHLEKAKLLTPWDTKIRTDYFGRKIGAFKSALTGDDVELAKQTAEELDGELALEIMRTPGELLFYRQRIYLYAISQGFPGYQRNLHLEAVDDALARFPGDPEFTKDREAVLSGAAQ